MKINFDNFLNEDVDPSYSHNLRMKKGYKPKYRTGLIGIRFQDGERLSGKKYQDVDDDSGTLNVNYQNIFSDKNRSDFITYFEDKYNVELSDYREGSDDFFIYFKCESGKEKETLEKISKDKIVKDVDYVDIREIESGSELVNIGQELEGLGQELSDFSDKEITDKISDAIERLKKLL